MIKQITLVLTLFLLIGTMGCSTSKDAKAPVVDGHTSQNSLDWDGYYAGSLMLKEQTDVIVKLEGTGTYELKYTDPANGPQNLMGMFEWNRQGSEITLRNTPKGNLVLKVGENLLIQDDKNTLRKFYLDAQLTEQYWKLTEIMGMPISAMGELNSEPHIIFKRDNNQVNGSLSCNKFFGGYTVPSRGQLSFGTLGATRMMCENMKIEDGLNHYLQKITHYQVDDKHLILKEAEDGKPLLKFENVKMK